MGKYMKHSWMSLLSSVILALLVAFVFVAHLFHLWDNYGMEVASYGVISGFILTIAVAILGLAIVLWNYYSGKISSLNSKCKELLKNTQLENGLSEVKKYKHIIKGYGICVSMAKFVTLWYGWICIYILIGLILGSTTVGNESPVRYLLADTSRFFNMLLMSTMLLTGVPHLISLSNFGDAVEEKEESSAK